MIWKIKNRKFDLSRKGMVMGILNLTDDSFSDGGAYATPEAAVARALAMEAEGAEIIDIGGESTRPGADPVSQEEELARVLPVLEALQGKLKAAISIDTYKPAVARAALERGAEIINDITALREEEMRSLAAETGAGVVLMHMKGTPKTMQDQPWYSVGVVAEIAEFFRQRWLLSLRSGIDSQAMVFDPGIGFGKTLSHNLALLRQFPEVTVENRPVLLGVSRKGFISKVTKSEPQEDRFWPTLALTSTGRELGARIFRVHDVRANVEALRMTEAILEGSAPA